MIWIILTLVVVIFMGVVVFMLYRINQSIERIFKEEESTGHNDYLNLDNQLRKL